MKSELAIVQTALLVCNADDSCIPQKHPTEKSGFFVTNSLYPEGGSLYSQGEYEMISLIINVSSVLWGLG